MAGPQHSGPIKFSSEELRVLQQCNKESFYQRCLPFSTTLGIGTYFAVKSGYLRPNSRFGAVPKVTAAVALGFVLGKFSYQKICAEKLMALPDSRVGQILRNRRQGIMDSPFTLGIPNEDQIIQNLPASEKYEDHKTSQLDMDFDRPNLSGLDDTFRPRIDDFPIPPSVHKDGVAPSASYDELRKKNRDEYELKRSNAYSGILTPDEVPSALKQHDEGYVRPRANPEPEVWSKPPPRKPTNIYGDTFER